MSALTKPASDGVKILKRDEIAWRAAQDVPDGAYVNLGIGIPTLVADYVPPGREMVLHSENGLLGVGPKPAPGQEDPELVNAGKELVTLVPGASIFHHTDSFAMIRGGHIDIALLGAFQVASNGDLANWKTGDNRLAPAVGGAMDLAAGAREVWVLMEHTTREGEPRIVTRCTYPLTAPGVVDRIYTNLALIAVTPSGLVVQEIVEGLDFAGLQAQTQAPLTLAADWRVMQRPGR
jgi:3-oxoadipate CoA-transferase beta subunit